MHAQEKKERTLDFPFPPIRFKRALNCAAPVLAFPTPTVDPVRRLSKEMDDRPGIRFNGVSRILLRPTRIASDIVYP